MPVFPSREWIEEFCERLAAHPDAAQAAEVLDGVYRFVIDPGGPLREQHVYDLAIQPDGDRAVVEPLDGVADDPRLTIRTSYDRWAQLIQGELDIGLAFMLGRLRIEGDIGTLRRNLRSARPLTDALNRVETEWLAT
jgi:hypothetical protein